MSSYLPFAIVISFLAAFICWYLYQKRKDAVLVKNEAWEQMHSDKTEVEKLLSDCKNQVLAEISIIENNWPVKTQTMDKLNNELTRLHGEIDTLSLKISLEALEHKEKIYECNSDEREHVMSFRKIQENVIEQCKTKKSDISALKEKFKLTNSAVLAETTRKTAEELGNLLQNRKNDLKLYKLPLQLTKAHKKNRRFELGADTGKAHRFEKIISNNCIVVFVTFAFLFFNF